MSDIKRGPGRPKGTLKGVNQKPMTFKVDFEIVEQLRNVKNKNSLVNQLLKEYFGSNS